MITEIQDDSAAVLGVGRFNRYDDNRRSLPSRLKKQPRPALNKDTFKKQSQEKPAQDKPMRVLSPVRRTVSLSSGTYNYGWGVDIVGLRTMYSHW